MKGEYRPKTFGTVLFPVSPVLYFLCVLCVPGGAARADEFSRASTYSVRMFSYGMLTVDTRTGDIEIQGWDNPRLEIQAEKIVRAKSASAAEPLYDRVKIQLQGQDKAVRLRTIYPPRRLWRPFRDESKLSVNFRIKMPYDANLTLHSVDGDVRVSGLAGRELIRVNYGDVEIDVPSPWDVRTLDAHAWLGYVQSDLHGGMESDSAGVSQRLWFYNERGKQDITVKVRMGGVWVYSSLQ
jgi:hypothetical protein